MNISPIVSKKAVLGIGKLTNIVCSQWWVDTFVLSQCIWSTTTGPNGSDAGNSALSMQSMWLEYGHLFLLEGNTHVDIVTHIDNVMEATSEQGFCIGGNVRAATA